MNCHLSTTSSHTILFLQRSSGCLNKVVFRYLWSMWLPKHVTFLKAIQHALGPL
ncbi:hypothetical protein HanPSC8_Chr04g0145641 [Helianthus annuus]|nr:hypothetical protein HanPSC8_Chr04g0145641 [Helianthus annuus]